MSCLKPGYILHADFIVIIVFSINDWMHTLYAIICIFILLIIFLKNHHELLKIWENWPLPPSLLHMCLCLYQIKYITRQFLSINRKLRYKNSPLFRIAGLIWLVSESKHIVLPPAKYFNVVDSNEKTLMVC